MLDFVEALTAVILFGVLLVALGVVVTIVRCWRKVEQGTALIITGSAEPTVHFSRAVVWPLIRRAEIMDISVKRIEIFRRGSEGLNCRDNVRADIKVAFFVRVNNTAEDVLRVAQSLGTTRASQQAALVDLFDAKFSEALKTVGKQFDFVELYTSREQFKNEILKIIGRDLNGYILDDAAIDYLEQTPVDALDPRNILDAEGIKKITDLTAQQQVLANQITRDKEKTIKKQDVEAREAILELERQQAEAEEKQHREIASVMARERAEALKVEQEERLRSERARVATEEELAIAEENKNRQIIVALRNKERTDRVEIERVEKDRQLEVTERERIVSLAQIDKEKAVETERRNIQEVIRERVMVERAVVEEQERIKDTHEFATAERAKRVAITAAEKTAQEALVREIKAAEAARDAAEFKAQEAVTLAESRRAAAEKESAGKKIMAEGITAEEAALGIAESQVIERKALSEARGIEAKLTAEAKGLEAKAGATEKQGTAEAAVMQQKFNAEATGITEKAKAMKLFHETGQAHEEFKLRLQKEKDVELAAIEAQREVAEQQAQIMAAALKSAKIDIVGGEAEFFDKITTAIVSGKTIDRWVGNSQVLTDIKGTLFNGDMSHLQDKLRRLIGQFDISSEDLKNLSIAALIAKLTGLTGDEGLRKELSQILSTMRASGMADGPAAALRES
ncbi:MAG: flotillin family protein [Planctomycetota bacterium]